MVVLRLCVLSETITLLRTPPIAHLHTDATLSQRQMFQNELRRQLGLFAAASSHRGTDDLQWSPSVIRQNKP